jgi:hypothetical protein
MPTVQGFGAFTGFQMREESAWGTGTGTWQDVPIIRETHKTAHDFAPPSPEFGDTGAETIVTHVSTSVVGEVVFNARLDATWFNTFVAHILGTEDLRNEEHVDGTAASPADDISTHWYTPSNQGRSLEFRVWKSGVDGTGSWSIFSGCIVNTARIEWVADGLLTWTINYVGKVETLATTSGSLGAPAGTITTDPRWASNTGAAFRSGVTPGDLNFRGFVININRAVTTVPSFANDIDTANQPGPTSKRTVTCNISSLLEQDFGAADKPYKEFVDKTTSAVRIKLRDTTVTADGGVYAIDLDFPSIVWTDGDTALKEPGTVSTGFQFQAKKGTPAAPTSTGGDTDWRIGVEVKESDEPAATPNHFTDSAGTITQTTT